MEKYALDLAGTKTAKANLLKQLSATQNEARLHFDFAFSMRSFLVGFSSVDCWKIT